MCCLWGTQRLVYTPIHVLLACFAFPLNKDGPIITREMAELKEWLHFPVAIPVHLLALACLSLLAVGPSP